MFLVYFFLIVTCIFALGKKDEAEKQSQNNEWVFCITSFDSTSLPGSKQYVAGLITRSLVERFNTISYRLRLTPEYAYYEGYAWAQARSGAAKALATKHNERSQLIYRGEPQWRYRQNLARLDTDIVKLKEALETTESNPPLINKEPEFVIYKDNLDGIFPAAPKEGDEFRFCQRQKFDAFLSGTVQEYHSRYYVTLRLFTSYSRSFVYEDDIIFSTDDIAVAVDEIAGRLISVLTGKKPAAIAIDAGPPETLILINRSFAGRGNVEAREYPPGEVTITLSAENYESETIETELVPGELAQVAVGLRRVEFTDVNILSSSPGAKVYQGALYVGEAPLTLRLPLNQLEYVYVEAIDGKTAKAVFQTPEKNSANFLTLRTKIPPSGKDRVNKARSWYYWAWGGTWLTGIAAWISYGLYNNSNEAISDGYNMGILHDSFVEENKRMYNISMVTAFALGAAVAFEVIQMARYIYTASQDAPPIVKTGAGGQVNSK